MAHYSRAEIGLRPATGGYRLDSTTSEARRCAGPATTRSATPLPRSWPHSEHGCATT